MDYNTLFTKSPGLDRSNLNNDVIFTSLLFWLITRHNISNDYFLTAIKLRQEALP